MHFSATLSTAAAFLGAGSAAILPERDGQSTVLEARVSPPRDLIPRQDSVTSNCSTFGIDFQDGGSYFLNSLLNIDFTCVSEFDGCNNDTAQIILVNDQDGDEYECTSVATVPDDTPELSTCPILQSQMTTGNWSVLIIGNNGDGYPFDYERNFFLTVGPQITITVTPTVTYNQTVTPTLTLTTLSTVDVTSTISNNLTITAPATTEYKTITPPAVTDTTTSTITKTRRSWTKTQYIITEIITASCTVPPRPSTPDHSLTFWPTILPLPTAHKYEPEPDERWKHGDGHDSPWSDAPSNEHWGGHKAREEAGAAAAVAAAIPHKKAKRAPDAPTVTSTASVAVNTTVTITAPATTLPDIVVTTATIRTTLPPATVKSGEVVDTLTLPAPTVERTTVVTTVTSVTTTLSLTWTYTTTTTPAASASACKSQGGHFGSESGSEWW